MWWKPHIVTPKLYRAMRTIPVGSERGPEEQWQSRDGRSLHSIDVGWRGNVSESREPTGRGQAAVRTARETPRPLPSLASKHFHIRFGWP